MQDFEILLEEIEAEYPKSNYGNYISSNYGRPMRIELKSGTIFGVCWFRWEHQNDTDLNNQIICFNSGKRDIDKFKIKYEDIESIKWD
jgi:hypothetical protein